MNRLTALLSGLIFGIGLTLSGMIDPARVLGFLDITGAWDPRLAFVLTGAVSVSAVGTMLSRRRARPVLAEQFEQPPSRPIDAKLLLGAAIFGVGWGLAGFCPGPAIASLSLGLGKSMGFVAAMLLGMIGHRVLFTGPGMARWSAA